jgi:hypothetical protein
LHLNKKYVEKSSLEEKEAEIGNLRKTIELRKLISEGSKEGQRAHVEYLKNYRANINSLHRQCFRELTEEKLLQATEYAGELNALDVMLSLLEDPEATLGIYRKELAQREKELRDLQKYDLRD